MKTEGGLMIRLSEELQEYFKNHPEELPAAVDENTLEIRCSSYLIEHIENYINKPFKDKFLWSLTFPSSKNPGFEYLYFITYKATYLGDHGIVTANLVYEKHESPAPWYWSN